MRTKCKSCIFGAFEDKKQVGCVLGKLDIYKQQGTTITREFSEGTGREYYVINDRYCLACRSERWLNSLPEGTDHLEKMEEEMAVQCQFIIISNNMIPDIERTVMSIDKQTLKASKITIADKPVSLFDDQAVRAEHVRRIIASIHIIETPYEIRSFTERFDDGKCIDLCVEHERPQYYCVVQAGCEVPETLLEELNDFVTKRLVQFSVIAADDHNNYMVVPFSVHTYLNGNTLKPLVEKLKEQEWENSMYRIQEVCPSTKA